MKSLVFIVVGIQMKKGMSMSVRNRPNHTHTGIEITAGDTPKAQRPIEVSSRGWVLLKLGFKLFTMFTPIPFLELVNCDFKKFTQSSCVKRMMSKDIGIYPCGKPPFSILLQSVWDILINFI
jgi:hypothetical protein